MRRLLPLLALLASIVAVGCGEDEEPAAETGNARALLQQAFSGEMRSGRLALESSLRIDDEAYALEVSGPFVSHGADKIPSADLDVSFSGFGPVLSGGVVLTEDNAFVSFGGDTYEVGEELVRRFNREGEAAADGRDSFEDFGVDPSRWLRDPEVAGQEDVEGTETTKISGDIDVERLLADFAKLDEIFGAVGGGERLDLDDAQRERAAEAIEESHADVYVADDGTLRRLVVDVTFKEGSAKLDLSFSDVGEPQRIEAPEDAKPIDELFGRFGLGQEMFQ